MDQDLQVRTVYAVSLLLLLVWSLVIPIFEAPDEHLHWQFARYLHDNRRLPLYQSGFPEANSPPLYYLLISPLATGSKLPPLYKNANGKMPVIASDGIVTKPVDGRVFANSPKDIFEYWHVRAARIATAFLSLIAIVFTFKAGRDATGRYHTGLLAAGLVGSLPQFSFRGMNVSNDPMVTVLSAASLYFMILLLKRGFSWPIGICAALTIASAFLSKINAVFLIAPFAVIILLPNGGKTTARLRHLACLATIILVCVAPWLLRNHLLYGDLLAERPMNTAVHSIITPRSLLSDYFITAFPVSLIRSFIGMFGWMAIGLSNWMYGFYSALFIAGLGISAWAILRGKTERRVDGVLWSFPLLSLCLVIYINLRLTQPQGRFLFPALPALAVLTAQGLEYIPGWSQRVSRLLLGVLFAANALICYTLYVFYWSA